MIENYQNIDILLKQDMKFDMYSVEICEKCYTKTVCDTSLTVLTYVNTPALVCELGFFLPNFAVGEMCMLCPLDSYCTGDGRLTACGQNEITLYTESPSIDFFICGEEGVFRGKIGI